MKILVTGDSWAAGDWNTELYKPILKDLLITDSHTVIHCPHPGQSDLPSILKVKENIKNVDFVIFFKTEVFRCFNKKNRLIAELNKKEYNLIKGLNWPSFDDYINLTKDELNLSDNIIKEMNLYGLYFTFSNFVENYSCNQDLDLSLRLLEKNISYNELFKINKKIMLIGGQDSIKTDLKFKYQIKSLSNFLINCNDDHYSVSDKDLKDFINLVKQSKLKNNLSDILTQIEKHINGTLVKWHAQKSDKKYFIPNDNGHPNETAINLYYHELIKPKLEEFKNDN